MFHGGVFRISRTSFVSLTCSQFDVPLLTVVDTITMDNTYCAQKTRISGWSETNTVRINVKETAV